MSSERIQSSEPAVIAIRLVFNSPPSVAAAGALSGTAQRTVQRNARGQFIIPGSHVKGKLRHSCERLLRALGAPVCESPRAQKMCRETQCPACRIFGSPAVPSPLRFRDLVAELGEPADEWRVAPGLRTMVSLNRRKQTAAEGKVFSVETAPHYSGLEFSNTAAITGALCSQAEVKAVLAGLKLVTGWGGLTSRGLGWAINVEAQANLGGVPVAPAGWREITQLWTD